jgi:hypothetical protein
MDEMKKHKLENICIYEWDTHKTIGAFSHVRSRFQRGGFKPMSCEHWTPWTKHTFLGVKRTDNRERTRFALELTVNGARVWYDEVRSIQDDDSPTGERDLP